MKRLLFFCYKLAVFIGGLLMLWWTWGSNRGEPSIDVFLFILLLWANNHEAISDSSGAFSVNFPLLFPVSTFLGPFWAGLVAGLGVIDRLEFKSHWTIVLLNRGSFILAAGLSSLVFHGVQAPFTVQVVVSTLVFIAVNTLVYIVGMFLSGAEDRDYIYHGLEAFKTFLPSGGLAVMFHYFYQNFSVWGVIAAYIVFLAVRTNVMFNHIQHKYRLSLIKALLRATQSKDDSLMSHLERVAYYSKHLARKCGYPRWKLQAFDEACYFHDIGKLEIDDSVLKKPGKLSDMEFTVIKGHPEKGVEFLKSIPIEDRRRQTIENIVLYHHERYDGRGYPFGLSGGDIPLEARIVAVADTWDAMTGERCYRSPLSKVEAIQELQRVKGTQLDPQVVDTFLEIIDDIARDEPNWAPVASGLATETATN